MQYKKDTSLVSPPGLLLISPILLLLFLVLWLPPPPRLNTPPHRLFFPLLSFSSSPSLSHPAPHRSLSWVGGGVVARLRLGLSTNYPQIQKISFITLTQKANNFETSVIFSGRRLQMCRAVRLSLRSPYFVISVISKKGRNM